MKHEGFDKVTIHADPEDEAFALDNGFDVALPFYIAEDLQGEVYIECYPQVEDEVRAYLSDFRDRLFSDEALSSLHRRLAPYLEKWGYEDDCHRMRRYLIYKAAPDAEIREAEIREADIPAGTGRITAKDVAVNRTTMHIADLEADGCILCGHVENGELLACAATHFYPDTLPAYVEVAVETAKEHRGRGLATGVLLALRRELAGMGHGMEYRASKRNIASCRTAVRCGLTPDGHCYYYVLRKKRTKR